MIIFYPTLSTVSSVFSMAKHFISSRLYANRLTWYSSRKYFYLREFTPCGIACFTKRKRVRAGGRIRARPRDVVYFIWNNCLCRSSNHGILVSQNCSRFSTTQYTVCGRWVHFCTLNSIRMNMNRNSEYISSEPFYSTLPLLPAHYLPFWDSLTRKATQYWSHIHSYYTYCPFSY